MCTPQLPPAFIAPAAERATKTDTGTSTSSRSTVTLAAVLELIDTSIVNVAIPHMMGNLGATLDEISWVSTAYIIANVIVIPMSAWLSGFFGTQAISHGLDRVVRARVVLLRRFATRSVR